MSSSWPTVKLGDVVSVRSDRVMPSAAGDLPFIGLEHVEPHTGRIITTAPASSVKSSASRFSAGNVLYGRLRPYLNKVIRPDFEGICSGEFVVMAPKPGLDGEFLRLRISAPDFVDFAGTLDAGDRPRVKASQIAQFAFQLPPIDEQHQIVEKIMALSETLSAAIEDLQRVEELTRAYQESLAAEALYPERQGGQPWPRVKLESVLERLTSGSRDWKRYYGKGDGVFLLAQNVRHRRLDLSTLMPVDPPADDPACARSEVKQDDVLITIVGAGTGTVARVSTDLPKHYVCQSVALLRPNEGISGRYLEMFLAAREGGQRVFADLMYGQGRPHLGFAEMKAIEVPLPSLAQQATIVESFEAQASAAESVVKDARAARDEAVLLHRASTLSLLRPTTLVRQPEPVTS